MGVGTCASKRPYQWCIKKKSCWYSPTHTMYVDNLVHRYHYLCEVVEVEGVTNTLIISHIRSTGRVFGSLIIKVCSHTCTGLVTLNNALT